MSQQVNFNADPTAVGLKQVFILDDSLFPGVIQCNRNCDPIAIGVVQVKVNSDPTTIGVIFIHMNSDPNAAGAFPAGGGATILDEDNVSEIFDEGTADPLLDE